MVEKKLSSTAFSQQLPFRRRLHAILLLDADHFKRINDEYRNERGDQVLRAISKRI